jgi:formylglycine-generating enzyme required for sulfatase activity
MNLGRTLVVAACAWLSACGIAVRPDVEDVATDAREAATDTGVRPDVRDVVDVTDVMDASEELDVVDVHVAEGLDVPDVILVTDARDADAADEGVRDVVSADTPIVVPCEPERPAPAGVGRSCTAATAAQCREVHYCGGTFTAGHRDALVPRVGVPAWERFRPCDFYRAVVRSGYVDAYEVTVARFRQWVDAGMPSPAAGTRIDPGITWDDDLRNAVRVLPFPSHSSTAPWPTSAGVGREGCTWTPTTGANENLPINCVEPVHAMAFCWWDGKQLMNEVSYEYLATNRGTTEASFGGSAISASLCDVADIGTLAEVMPSGSTLCPRRVAPLAFDARPRDVTRDPAGVFNLFGGMREWLFMAVPLPPGMYAGMGPTACSTLFPRLVVEGEGRWVTDGIGLRFEPYSAGAFVTRGVAWSDNRQMLENWRFATSRPSRAEFQSSGVDRGFRCQRWESR